LVGGKQPSASRISLAASAFRSWLVASRRAEASGFMSAHIPPIGQPPEPDPLAGIPLSAANATVIADPKLHRIAGENCTLGYPV
jgi:hypothetical protein